jgi:hypothetical protein
MTRNRYIDVYVPMGTGSDGGSGVGVIGAMAALFGGVVGIAVVACVAVSCADFGNGAQIPASDCTPFCASSSAAVPSGEIR